MSKRRLITRGFCLCGKRSRSVYLLPALGLATETPEDDVMRQPPRDPGDRLLSRNMLLLSYGCYGTLQAAAGFTAYFAVLTTGGWAWGQSLGPDDLLWLQAVSTFFVSIVVTQVADVLACRSRRQSVFSKGVLSNRLVLVGIAVELALAALIVYTPAAQSLFLTAALPGWVWLVSVPFALLCWPWKSYGNFWCVGRTPSSKSISPGEATGYGAVTFCSNPGYLRSLGCLG